jgi:opacity protein-like surface antigen
MKLRLALAAATCLALPVIAQSSAHAQPVSGPYISLEGGTSILAPVMSKLEGANIGNGGEPGVYFKNQFHNDYAGVGGVGYGFGNGFRVQLDGDFIRNTAAGDTVSATGFMEGESFSESYNGKNYGAEEKYGPMLNLLYDLPVEFPVTPYVGGGVGYQWVKFNRDLRHTVLGSPFDAVSGTKGSFAVDAIAGLAYPLPVMPQLAVTAEYRFMFLPGSRKYPVEVRDPGPFVYNEKFSQESSHTFLVGLRYTLFGPAMMAPAPTPAPMASPAPAAAKTYLVFFDWDKYSLTPRATQIIAEAASDSKTNSVTTLNVSGYTDTSGTPTYNQGLSERRAKAVAAKLVSDGVPASEISIHAYGETHLLVPTGPGVREPQNRRVEIVLD